MAYRYFALDEFCSPDQPGSGQNMRAEFLRKLDEARHLSGVPYIINSGYRTLHHNAAIGGHHDSAHLGGWAADIHATSSEQRARIIMGLILAGFNRIGIARTFIHCDCSPLKTPNVVWLYK